MVKLLKEDFDTTFIILYLSYRYASFIFQLYVATYT